MTRTSHACKVSPMEMSDRALEALVNVGCDRQGATISPYTSDRVVRELRALGLIGDDNGLTRQGSIERQRIMSVNLDTLFA